MNYDKITILSFTLFLCVAPSSEDLVLKVYDKHFNYTTKLIKVSNDRRKLITRTFKCYIYPAHTVPIDSEMTGRRWLNYANGMKNKSLWKLKND